MPAFIATDTIEVTLVWQLAGDDHAVNVLHYLVPPTYDVTGDTTGALAALVGAAFDAGVVSYKDLVANNFVLARIEVRDLREPNLPVFIGAIASIGLAAADPLPASTAYVVTLRTAKAGRSFRGRVYLPGWAEGQNDPAGQATEVVRTAALEFMGAMESHTVSGNLLVLGSHRV